MTYFPTVKYSTRLSFAWSVIPVRLDLKNTKYALQHTLPTPRSGQYLTHAHSHITPSVAAMDSGFVLAKDETAFHGCHYQGDMAVRMRKVLAIPQSW